jgi:uncharacterized membrane protein YoaK (UPF0700 family)
MKLARPPHQVMTLIAVLLTFASGATDVASFTKLGVFASVMTGNIALFGLSLAKGSVSLGAHTAVAVGGYMVGVAAGTRVAWFHAFLTGSPRPSGERSRKDMPWPPHVTMAVLLEFLLVSLFSAGWEITGGNPAGATQYLMLAGIACGMGIQASAVLDMDLREVSTTYLTGTLTGLIAAVASPGRKAGLRRPGVLIGLAIGAVLSGILVAYLPALMPALPLAALATVIVLGSSLIEDHRALIPLPRKPA